MENGCDSQGTVCLCRCVERGVGGERSSACTCTWTDIVGDCQGPRLRVRGLRVNSANEMQTNKGRCDRKWIGAVDD